MTTAVHNKTNPPASKSQSQIAGDLESRAQKMAQIYQDLVTARKAFSERDESQFYEDVEFLSLQLSFLERDILKFETQFAGDNKVPEQVQKIRQILKGSPLAPNAIPRTEQTAVPSNFEKSFAKAEDAADQFEAFLALECDIPDAEQELAINMHNQMQIVKQNDDPTFRKSRRFRDLLEKHDDLLRRAYAPKICPFVTEQFQNILERCAGCLENAENGGDPIQKYLATQLLENEMSNFCAAHNLNPNFFSNSFRFKHPIFGEIDTDLSNLKADFAARTDLSKQFSALRHHIDREYTPKRVPLDGNCFFHSAAHFAPGLSHDEVRRNIHQHMTRYKEAYRSVIKERINNEPELRRRGITTVESYLSFIQKNGTWGGKPELQALSDLLGRPILVRQKGGEGKRKGIISTFFPIHGIITNHLPLMILNSGEGHFEPLIQNQN